MLKQRQILENYLDIRLAGSDSPLYCERMDESLWVTDLKRGSQLEFKLKNFDPAKYLSVVIALDDHNILDGQLFSVYGSGYVLKPQTIKGVAGLSDDSPIVISKAQTIKIAILKSMSPAKMELFEGSCLEYNLYFPGTDTREAKKQKHYHELFGDKGSLIRLDVELNVCE